MKKNAILVASILFIAGCAHQRNSYRADLDSRGTIYPANNTEVIVRDSEGNIVATTPSDSGVAAQYDSGTSSPGHIMADSSKRGGSMEARGYNSDMNEHEITTNPMNPAYKADSSIRGGSTAGRNTEWNTRPEPSAGYGDTHIKADSSKRGGSMEARGYDKFSSNFEDGNDRSYSYQSDSSTSFRDDAAMENELVQDSDLNRGGFDVVIVEPDSLSDTGVGAAAESSVGTGSSKAQNLETSKSNLDDIDIQSTADDSARGRSDESVKADQNSAEANGQLNSSPNVERNIAGEFDLQRQNQNPAQSDARLNTELGASTDPNMRDTFESSVNSSRSTDITHGTSEGIGAAATAESGSSSSSNDASVSGSVNSGSDALPGPNSRITSNDPNWLMKDNPAQGIGSGATGQQGSGLSAESSVMSNDQLAQRVKAELVKESTGTHDMLPTEVARNITVSADNGVVTLKGSVPTLKDKNIVDIRAREVKGVARVNNQLKVNPQSDPDLRDLTKGHELEERTDQIHP